MVRNDGVPLHQALDTIAREEGFARWSLLSAHASAGPLSQTLLSQLKQGDMLLLAGRRGQGKTALGLQLLLDAARLGRKAVFFTLEFTEAEARAHLHVRNGGADEPSDKVEIVNSPEISADYIVRHPLRRAGGKCRGDRLPANSRPEAQHAASLRTGREPSAFAKQTGTILGFISQIDRTFDPESKPLPESAICACRTLSISVTSTGPAFCITGRRSCRMSFEALRPRRSSVARPLLCDRLRHHIRKLRDHPDKGSDIVK